MQDTSEFSYSSRGSVRLAAFRGGFYARVNGRPTLHHTFAVIFFDEAQCQVTELDQRAAWLFGKAVLQIGRDGIGHEERTNQLQQRRSFDRLHVGPKVAVSPPRSRNQRPPGHASSFIGIGPTSGTSFIGPSCSSSGEQYGKRFEVAEA